MTTKFFERMRNQNVYNFAPTGRLAKMHRLAAIRGWNFCCFFSTKSWANVSQNLLHCNYNSYDFQTWHALCLCTYRDSGIVKCGYMDTMAAILDTTSGQKSPSKTYTGCFVIFCRPKVADTTLETTAFELAFACAKEEEAERLLCQMWLCGCDGRHTGYYVSAKVSFKNVHRLLCDFL